jgi:uncharacterized protein (DUF1501 family)
MFTRRQFLTRSLQGASLLALAPAVPQFLANTARAAEAGKDTVLVVIELSGGNDGLNTVIPYADDNYHKARPTLHFTKEQVVKVNDTIGLHPGLRGLDDLLQKGQLAIVQGVGYPNPDRSHFESMDVWQSGDPKRKTRSGWIARGAEDLNDKRGGVPIMQVGQKDLPLALQGAPGAVVSINDQRAYRLDLGAGDAAHQKARRKLLEEVADPDQGGDDLLQFVRRRQAQTYTTLDRIQEVLKAPATPAPGIADAQALLTLNQPVGVALSNKLQLVARLIDKGFGTRVFYVNLDGFDTHANQAATHQQLFTDLSAAVAGFFTVLRAGGHDKRVLAMTFSEFGRRVNENGSKGTDHGSGSCLFVAGPAVKGGPVNKHPSLKNEDLDSGDVRYTVDFRRVYATLLDRWLGCDSNAVLGAKFEPLDLLKPKA